MAHIRKSASKPQRKRFPNQKNNILSCRAKSRNSDMKFSLSVVVVLLCVAMLRAEKISLVGATVINPGDGKVLRSEERRVGKEWRERWSRYLSGVKARLE